jgi:hypothetical protein
MKYREPAWTDDRAKVFEQPLGKRNYLVGGDSRDVNKILNAIGDLLGEMKEHKKERQQLNAEIERLKKFGVVTTGAEQKIAEREMKLKQDFEGYAKSVIDLLARAGVTESKFNINREIFNNCALSTTEKQDVKLFIHAVMKLYSLPLVDYMGNRDMKVSDAKQRITQVLGATDPVKEKELLADLGYKKQSAALGSQLQQGQTLFAKNESGIKQQIEENFKPPVTRKTR